MAHLSLSLLGPFQATLNGRPITDFKSNKVRALLAYLAAEADRPHPREALAGLLWPDYTDRAALDNLRYTLSSLRQAIDDRSTTPPFLIITRDTIQFNSASDYALDLAGFEVSSSLASIGQLEQMIALYRGCFLEGFSCDSAAFEEWILFKREQVSRRVLIALRRLTTHYGQSGEYERAAIYARKQLELEPWDEEAYQQLMRALALSGQRSAALAQYETCRRLLLQELGVGPSSKTVALRDQIEQELIGAASQAQAAWLTHVPIPLTPFVGRQREVADIKRVLMDSESPARLLTLTGAGGCGKTRLAIQVAGDLAAANHFTQGVCWVDLAGLSDAARLPQAVATAFGLRESSDTPLSLILVNYLRAKEMLVVFDNCEHVIDDCARLIEQLLSACPQLQILTTSREPIGLTGEGVWRVPSLALPDADAEHLPPNRLLHYDAISLFVQRAVTISPQWEFAANASAVARICTRLDGLALAIELAAARLRVLSAEQIASRLDDRFELLTDGSRTALPRHQTLRATMDWSYGFLSDDERQVFQRLSVFADGWTLEAAEQVASDDRSGLRQSEVLDRLAHLVDKSLVAVEKQAGEVRYRLLETIREYARDKLIATGETEALRDRHLTYFMQYAERLEPHWHGAEQKFWLNQIEAEHDNLRAALGWAIERGRASATQRELGLRLAVALGEFWDRRNYWKEGHDWLDRGLNTRAGDIRLRAQADYLIGRLERLLGDTTSAKTHIEESLSLAQTAGHPPAIALALLEQASLLEYQRDFATARSIAEESLKRFQSLGDVPGAAHSCHRLGHVLLGQHNSRGALAYFEESRQLFQKSEDKLWMGILLDDLARVAHQEGDYALARTLSEEALAIEDELGYKFGRVATLWLLGELAHLEGDYPKAAALYEASLTLARESDSKSLIAAVLPNVGYVALHDNDSHRAQQLLQEGLEYARDQRDKDDIVHCLAGMASVLTARGQLERATGLLGATEAQLAHSDCNLSPACRMEYERTVAIVRTQLDEAAFNAELAMGRALTLEQAIEFALAQA